MAKALTNRELVELLLNFDPEAEVITEGCDCNGLASGVYEDNGFLYITRDN